MLPLPNFSTAHSTASSTNLKKKTPTPAGTYKTPATTLNLSSKPYVSVSDNIKNTPQSKPPTPIVPSSATSPKAQFVNNVTNTSSGPDLTSLLPGLQKLHDSLGTYGKNQNTTTESSSTPQNTPAVPDPYDKTRSAMDAYIASLSPSGEEEDLQKRLNNLQQATRSGVARQEEDAIPMSFITGRQASIENRGREMTDPLEAELTRLSGNRTAMSEGAKARYEFEQALAGEQKEDMRYDRQQQREDDRYNQGTLEKAGNNIIRIKPDGTYETVYEGSPEVDTQIIQSGGKNVLINSTTGEIISDLGATEGALTRASRGSGSSSSSAVNKVNQAVFDQLNEIYGVQKLAFDNPTLMQDIFDTIDGATSRGEELSISKLLAVFPELSQGLSPTKEPGVLSKVGNWFKETF